MSEVWRDIPGYGGYQASSMGRIRSVDRYIKVNRAPTPYTRLDKGRVLTQLDHQRPAYNFVQLGRKKNRRVHVLVALAFLGPCPKGLEIRHLDGNARNNAVSNLCYGTRKENVRDACEHGRVSSLSKEQVLEIRRKAAEGLSHNELAKAFNLSYEMAWKIATGRAYKWVRQNEQSQST